MTLKCGMVGPGFMNNLAFMHRYLGSVDKLGTAYEDNIIGTGLGMQIGVPLIREAFEKKPTMSKSEAQQLLAHTMEVLFYRDARSFPKVNFLF